MSECPGNFLYKNGIIECENSFIMYSKCINICSNLTRCDEINIKQEIMSVEKVLEKDLNERNDINLTYPCKN